MSHYLRRLKSAARPVSALFIACLFVIVAALPAAAVEITAPGSGTWVAPAGVTSVTVECWGAGGGGGGDSISNTNTNGGGGGGGAYAKVIYAVTPGSSYNYTVGTGGAGGISTANGSNGGNSTFQSTICVAAGGKGGNSAANGTNGGAGGLASASTGTVTNSGGSGSNDVNNGGGGGGGSAGTGIDGISASNSRTGAGAVTGGGPGGDGAQNGNGSAPAFGPGGGGGGGKNDGTNRDGGAGFDGKIRITINATLGVTNSPATYTGTAQSATLAASFNATNVPGTFSNVRYNGSTTVPTNAGTYAVTADFTPTDTATYATLTGAAAGSFIINKATPTLTITNSPVTYTGAQRTATVSGSTGGTVSNIKYNTSATAPTNAGSYAVTANFTPSDTTNFNSLIDATAGTFVINKATPTLSIGNSPVVYDGTAKTAAVTGSTAGAVSNILYGGSATAPTNAGTYAVTADFLPADTTNYNSLTTGSAGNFVISKATPTLSVTNSPVTYNGAAQAATVASSVPGTISNVRYNNSSTVPTSAATYAITANFAPTDSTNYNSLTNASAGSFIINKATPTLSVTNSPLTYNGSQRTATVTGSTTGSVSTIRYDNSATAPTNAGTYAVTANFTPNDTTNYISLTGASAGNFIINQAATTTTVSCSGGPFTYTGAAITPTCTAAATGAGGLNATGLAVTFANNTNAGTATASASYAGAPNYLPSNGSTTFTIGKATPTLAISNSPVTFDGTARTATIAANGPAGAVPGAFANVLYNLSAAAPTDAGTYAVKADFTPGDTTNYNSLTGASAGSFVINKAASTTVVTCDPGPFAYTGVGQTPCTATTTGPGGLSLTPAIIFSNNINAGTATAAATYAASTNYLGSSDSKTFTIDKAATTTAITCAPGPFFYTGAAQMPCTADVTGPGGLNLVLTVVYAGNIDAGTATADASYGGTANYLASNDSTTFAIDKATPVLAVTNSPAPFDGAAKTANIAATATAGTVNGTLSNVQYDASATEPTDAGTYAVTADFTPNDLANYNSLNGAGAGSFTIAKAATTTALSCNAGPFTFTGAAITPCAASVTGPGGLNLALTVSYAGNIDAGPATASASYAGSANYAASSDSATFTIDQASTTTTVTCATGPFTYTGAAIEPCTADVTGPGGLSLALTVAYANNIGAGTASAGASYGGAANYLPSSDSATFPIGKATPVLAVSNSPQVFDGTAKAATVAASAPAGTVAGNFSGIRYDGSTTEPADAGSYAVTADFTPLDTANYNLVGGGNAGSFIIQPAATTTTVTCSAGPFVYNGAPHEPCAAVATGPAGLNLAVAVVYADNTNAGTAAADANYAGAANYLPSSGSATFPIDKADPTISIGNSPVTYDGTAKTAAVSGSVAGTVSSVKYDGLVTEPIGAGSYAVTADFLPTDANNYNALSNAGAGSFVINKADPVLSITNSPADYDGTPKAANVVGSVAGTVSNVTYNTVGAAPTNAGTYAVNADFLPQDTANYNSLTGAAAGNFVIQKAGTPTLSVSNSPLIFNGLPQPAVVAGSVPGTVSGIRYNGSPTTPTDAGSYVITADFTPDDTINYDTLAGAAAGTLVIDQAATSTAVTCAAGPFTYTGLAQTPCTAAVSGPGGLSAAVTVVYAGNIDAGTASASAAFAGNANYLPSSNATSFVIGKADPVLTVTNSPATYDGTPKTANVVGSVAGTVSNIRYNGSANAPVDAGTYAITADFVPGDAANYNTLGGANAGNFVVQKAGVPVLTVTNSPRLFTGAAQAAIVVGSVPGTVSNIRYDGSPSAPAGAGTYVITADFVPNDTVNYDTITGASAGSFTIGRAVTTTAINCGVGPHTYTGAPITPCTATVTGPGGLSAAVAVSYSSNTNVGTAAASANYAGGANYLPSSAAGSFTIAKAATTTTVTCAAGPFVYTGAAIEPCTAVVTGPGGLSEALAVVYSNNVNVGTASANASYAGGANYLASSAVDSFTIGQAATTTIVTCAAGPFTVTGSAIEPCTAVVTGPGGLSQALAVVYSNNVNVGTASATASYAGSANYLPSSDTEVFVIGETVETTVFVHLPFMSK